MASKDEIKQITDDILKQLSIVTNVTNGFLAKQITADSKQQIIEAIDQIVSDMRKLAVCIDARNPAVIEVFAEMDISPMQYIIYLMNTIEFVKENILHERRMIMLKEEFINAGHA